MHTAPLDNREPTRPSQCHIATASLRRHLDNLLPEKDWHGYSANACFWKLDAGTMSDRNELTHTCIFIPPTQAHLSLPTAIGQSSSCLQPSRPRPSNGYQSYPKCSPKRCPNQCKILLALLPLRMAARPSKVIRQPHECVASFLEHRLRYEDTWIISC